MKLTPIQKKILRHLNNNYFGSSGMFGQARAHYLSSCRALVRRGLLIQGERNTDFYINDAGRMAINEAQP